MSNAKNNAVKKIAVLLPSMQIGGAERLVLEEMRVLKEDDRFSFEVHLMFQKGSFYDHFANIGMPIKVWNAKHGNSISILFKHWRMALYLKRNKFSVLHCHLLYRLGPWVGVIAGMRKIITTVHTKQSMGKLDQLGLSRSDVVFACSRQVADHLQSFVDVSRIRILNNAIAVPTRSEEYIEKASTIYDINEGQKVILSIGRLIFDKGYDVLIDAFEIVSKVLPDTVLLIAGDGPERNSLCNKIEERGLCRTVRLLGLVDDVSVLFERADIYVNSSRREGLPLTLIEAGAFHKAIVATDVGGNSDFVKNDITGLLVSEPNPETLAGAMISLIKDKKRSAQLGRGAYDLFKIEYNISDHCRRLAEEYSTV